MPEIEVNECMPVAESPTDQPDLKMKEKIEENEDKFESEATEKSEKVENSESKEEEETDEKKDEWLDILGSGQLKMKVIEKGESGTRPQASDICTIKYVGKLEDGTIVEESDSLEIQLGESELIQGLDIAIALMNVGEETTIVVHPRFAYGSLGLSPKVPPDAIITYVVKLLNVELEPEIEKIPFEKRREIANAKRERGNWWYSRQDPTKAIQCYRKALSILDDVAPFVDEAGNTIETPEDVFKESIEQRLTVYNNLAAAQLMNKAYDSALASVDNVIQCQPNNVKALFRKGKILAAKGCINEAIEILKHAFSLQPENSAIKTELSRCLKIQQQEKEHEKNLYKKMFGQDKKQEKINPSPRGKRGSWTKIVGTAATATFMVAIAFAVGYRYKNYTFL